MRYIVTMLITGIIVFAQDVRADEFGERFYNQTPAGMAEYTAPENETSDIAMDEWAEDLQNITPASGEEEVGIILPSEADGLIIIEESEEPEN